MDREIILRWIDKALDTRPGEELFLPCESKQDQKALFKAIRKELGILKEIDPSKASTLAAFTIFRDHRLWVGIQRVVANPLVGFVKKLDDTVERIELLDPKRERRLLLMKEDGFSLKEMEAVEGPLTEEERQWVER